VRVPTLVVLVLSAASAASLTIASLALADLFWGWGVFFFYTVPAIFFLVWTVRELAPTTWRRVVAPLRWAWRGTALGRPSPLSPPPAPRELPGETAAAERRPRPAAEPRAGERKQESPPGPGDELVGSIRALLRAVLGAWLILMRWLLSAWRAPRSRRALSVGFGLAALGTFVLVVLEFVHIGWPLERADASLTAASGALFLSTYAFKALGWQRLFRAYERPRSLALAAATGAAAVAGLALPGRFDDAVRVAILRRMPGPRPGVGTLVLSLFLLGMVDTVALAPLAAAAAVATETSLIVRIAFAVVAGAGVGAGIVLAALPRIVASERLGHYRLTHWLSRHAPASRRDALWSFVFVSAAWLARGAAIFILLSALGFAVSFGLALTYLAAGAAAGALPISPAGAATQAGVGAAVLAAAGIDAARAVAFAIAAQALTVLAGATIVLFTIALHGGRRLLPA
jgi:uncharacterized membrane protein YbhN (UPF0104 family)